MSTFNINGTAYTFPDTGDENWGDNVTSWASAVSTGLLQKAGGSFVLTAEVDFGATYGLKSVYLKSRATNPASTGEVRLGNTQGVYWRNAANSADLALVVNASNELTYNGNVVTASGGAVPLASGGTGLTSYTAGDTVYFASGTSFTKLAIGSANTVMVSTGSAPSWALVSLTANVSGVLPVANGGTNLSSYTAGDVPYATGSTTIAKLAIGSANTVLTSSGSAPQWSTSLSLGSNLGVIGAAVASTAIAIRPTAVGGSNTDQYGILCQVLGNSSATVSLVGVYSGPRTAAAAHTVPYRAAFFADIITKGAGSTITRDISYYATTPSEGTNNASIADNVAFSGNYFLNSTNTNPSVFSGILSSTAGLKTKLSTDNVSNPPTEAQIITAFGTAATVGSGFIGIIDDTAGHTNEYLCWSDGTKWFYVTGTLAT